MDSALLAEAAAAIARLQDIVQELRNQAARRCDDCGRTARELQPIFEDVAGVNQPVAWLGPTCYRRRLDAMEAAAVGDHVCQPFPVQLHIAEGGSDG